MLDLRGNSIQQLGLNLRLSASALPPYTLLLEQNDFHCDCHSEAGLLWLRSTRAVRDADALHCRLASPPRFKVPIPTSLPSPHSTLLQGAALLTVPIQDLDCATVLNAAFAQPPNSCLAIPLTLTLAACLRP